MSQIIKNSSSGTLPPSVATSYVTDDGTSIPVLNIEDIFGQKAATVPVMETHAPGSTNVITIENRSWITQYIVDSSSTIGLQGTFTTIAAATAAASSGQVVAIRSGTYTENITMKDGVNYIALGDDRFGGAPTVSIVGKFIDNGSPVNCSFSGIRFNTNSDYVFSLSAASDVVLSNCYVSGANHTPFNMSNSSANIYCNNVDGNLNTTGISLFNITHGDIWFNECNFTNSGVSTTATTLSDGSVNAKYSYFETPFATSGTGVAILEYCIFGPNTSNHTWLTTSGTVKSFIEQCELYSGTASAVSIGSGTTVDMNQCIIESSNTNILTGAGTLNFSLISCNGSSSGVNVSTVNDNTVIPSMGGGGGVTPLAQVFLSATQSNVTGNGTLYQIPYNTAAYNIGTCVNLGTGTFTAPSTGLYLFTGILQIVTLSGATQLNTFLQTSATNFQLYTVSGSTAGNSQLFFNFSLQCVMTSGDVAKIAIENTGGSSNSDDVGGGSLANNNLTITYLGPV